MTESQNSNDIDELPEEDKGDIAHALARAAISAIPFVGGPAVELFNLVLEPSLERRRDAWLRELGDVLEELRSRLEGFDPRDLQDNEMFVTAVLHASPIALKTHQDEKIRALKNALIHAAMPGAPEEHLQLMFLRFIDELTPLHFRMLSYMRDPKDWFIQHGQTPPNLHMGSPGHVLESALSELTNRRSLYDQAMRELHIRGLVGTDSLHVTMTAEGAMSPLTTPLGNQFVEYITLADDRTKGP